MQAHTSESSTLSSSAGEPRRSFLARWPSWWMVGGLIGGYGSFAALVTRFLLSKSDSRQWQFVTDLGSIRVGESINYLSPAGQRVVITRVADQGRAADFIALSSVCPHLGCQVHWEQQNNRFFCPCHNGAFDREGNPTEGPPKDANQPLPRYPLRVDEQQGLLYIEVETERLVSSCEVQSGEKAPAKALCARGCPGQPTHESVVRLDCPAGNQGNDGTLSRSIS